MKELIKGGADLNLVTETNFTPLWWATRHVYRNLEIVRLLVEAGCDVNLADTSCRRTPLMVIDRFDKIKLLIESNVCIV